MDHTHSVSRSDINRSDYIHHSLPNVVRDIRIASSLTQQELAEEAGLTRMFILRAEQYLHNTLSPSLATALSVHDSEGRTAVELIGTYSNGRRTQLHVNSQAITQNGYYGLRVRNAINYAIDNSLDSISASSDGASARFHHPFALFRTHLFSAFDMPTSQIKFCTITGVHPTVLANLENYKGTMDDTILNALSDVLCMDYGQVATLKLVCDRVL